MCNFKFIPCGLFANNHEEILHNEQHFEYAKIGYCRGFDERAVVLDAFGILKSPSHGNGSSAFLASPTPIQAGGYHLNRSCIDGATPQLGCSLVRL